MYLSPNKLVVLRSLRHGPLTLPEVADETDLPQFTARSELKDLKRARLVTDVFTSAGHLWELTNPGCALAWASDQTELPVEVRA